MIYKTALLFLLGSIGALMPQSEAFSSPSSLICNNFQNAEVMESRRQKISRSSRKSLICLGSTTDSENSAQVWNPKLRRAMGGVAGAGVLETGYLTFNKLFSDGNVLCSVDGGSSCNDVLNGPYSYVPFTSIPLSAMGFLAYATVAGLALAPLLFPSDDADDSSNRVALTAITTAMGTFSIFLMTLLFGVLETSCPYCVFSAACSVILAKLAWIGGCLPDGSKTGAKAAGTSFLAATLGAVLLFVSGVEQSDAATDAMTRSLIPNAGTSTLLASNNENKLYSPPAITTESSSQALKLADELKALDAKMFGAYWCSHCYDQKETFGKQAFAKLTYVECSKDGVNSQTKMCKANEVPGYPTWQIQGKLYPGQQELDELEDIVKSIKAGN